MFAANCAQLAPTRIGWANKAKGIAVGTARLAEVANSGCATFHRAHKQVPDRLTRNIAL